MESQTLERTSNQINIKLVILGDGGVGKTCLINYFLKKKFLKRYIPTIGSIILKKDYKLDDIQLKINIWDIGGQKSFNPLNPSFYTNVDAAYLVFDLNKPKETLSDIKKEYLKNLEKYATECQTLVVANKLDLINLEKDLEKIIKKYFMTDVPLVITSARNGINVAETFELLIYSFLQEYEISYPEYFGVATKFLNVLGKDENDLMGKLLNIGDIDSLKLQKEKPKETVAPVEVEEEDGIKVEAIVTSESEEKIVYYEYLPTKHDLEEMDVIQNEIIKEFNSNLTKVEELIVDLKKTPIDSLLDSIDNTKEQLEGIKENFKSNLQSIMNLEKKNKNLR